LTGVERERKYSDIHINAYAENVQDNAHHRRDRGFRASSVVRPAKRVPLLARFFGPITGVG